MQRLRSFWASAKDPKCSMCKIFVSDAACEQWMKAMGAR